MNFDLSKAKDKKFSVLYHGHLINFGQKGYEHYKTSDKIPQKLHVYNEHHDKERRKRFRERASKIRNAKGELTYKNPLYANYWSYTYLW